MMRLHPPPPSGCASPSVWATYAAWQLGHPGAERLTSWHVYLCQHSPITPPPTDAHTRAAFHPLPPLEA